MRVKFTQGDGPSTPLKVDTGEYVLAASGDFGGGTVAFKITPDGMGTIALTAAAMDAPGIKAVVLPRGEVVFEMSGSTDPECTLMLTRLFD